MKKIVSIITLLMLLCGLTLSLTSCFEDRIDPGKYIGTDGSELEALYEQLVVPMNEEDVAGTLYIVYNYVIDDDKITLTVDRVDYFGDDAGDYEERMNAYLKGKVEVLSFEELDDGSFKMGGVTFTKQ